MLIVLQSGAPRWLLRYRKTVDAIHDRGSVRKESALHILFGFGLI